MSSRGWEIHYSRFKWSGKKPKEGKPACPKCASFNVKELRRYAAEVTEMFVDYECKDCGNKFTVNWS